MGDVWDSGATLDDKLSGSGIVGDYALAGEALASGDWAGAFVAVTVSGLDTVAAASDPIGTAVAAGFGFILDHLNPLKKWLNELTGDAGAVDAHKEEWKHIAERLEELRGTVEADVAHDLAGQSGLTVESYREHAEGLLKAIDSSKTSADGMASAIELAGAMVEIVHGLVRDALSDIVGRAVSWAAEEIFSLGTATALVIEQVSTEVAKWVGKVSSSLHELVSAIQKLSHSVKELGRAGEAVSRLLDKVASGAGKVEHVVAGAEKKVAGFEHEGDHHKMIPNERAHEGKPIDAHRGEEKPAPEHEPKSHRGEPGGKHAGDHSSGEHHEHRAGDHKNDEKTWGNQAKDKAKEFARNEALYTGAKGSKNDKNEKDEEAREAMEGGSE